MNADGTTNKKRYLFFLRDLFLKNNSLYFFLNVTFYIFDGVMLPVAAWCFGCFIDELTCGGTPIVYLSLFLVATIARSLFEKLSQYTRENSIYHIQQYIDRLVCEHLAIADFDKLDTEEYRKKFSVAKKTNTNVYMLFSYMMDAVSMLIGIFVSLLILSQSAVWVSCVYIFALLIELPIYKKFSFEYWNDFAKEDIHTRKLDYFIGLFMNRNSRRDIRGNNAGRYFLDKISFFSSELFREYKVHLRSMNKKILLTQLMTLIIPILTAVYSLNLFITEKIGAGSVITLISVAKGLHSSINSFGLVFKNIITTNESLKNSYDVIFESSKVSANVNYTDVNIDKVQKLQFQHVSFKYPDSENYVLKDVSFEFEGSGSMGIVGLNGAGKSTIIKLLIGIYSNYEGEIYLNGINIKMIPNEKKENMFSVCFQDYICPHLLLREAMAISDVSKIGDDFLLEGKIKQVGEDKYLINHLNSQIGLEYSEGIELSRGQWQKIAIVRSLVPKCSVLIFDEPLASLDIYSEKAYYEQFSALEGCMSIFVSHRMHGLRSCKKIIVLENGRITEQGTHEELIDNKGLYYRMYEA